MMKFLATAGLAALLLTPVLASVAYAQDTAPAPAAPAAAPAATPAPDAAAEGTDTPEDKPLTQADILIPEPGEKDYLAKDELIGLKVHNIEGKIIGDVEDLIIDENDQVIGLLMGVGGFVGVGEKKIAIKYEAFEWSEKEGKSYVTLPLADKAFVEAAAPFKRRVAKKTLYDRAVEKAQELRDKTTESSKDAYDKAKPTIEKAKQDAADAYEKAKAAAKSTVDSVTGKPATTPESAPAPVPAPKPAPAPAP